MIFHAPMSIDFQDAVAFHRYSACIVDDTQNIYSKHFRNIFDEQFMEIDY